MLRYSNDFKPQCVIVKKQYIYTVSNVVRVVVFVAIAIIMQFIPKSPLARGIKNAQPFNHALQKGLKRLCNCDVSQKTCLNMFHSEVLCGTCHPAKCHMNDMTGYATGAPQTRVTLLWGLNSYIIVSTHMSARHRMCGEKVDLCIYRESR